MKTPKQIFIGGAAGEDTTLIAKILNNHPDIWCGEETSIFDRPALYRMKPQRLGAMMSVNSYMELDQSMPYAITIQQPRPMSYCGLASWRWGDLFLTDRNSFIGALGVGRSIIDSLEEVFEEIIAQAGKKIWCDKTTGNIFCMGELAAWFPESKRVIVVRNPYDTIMSLVFNRNFSLHNAIIRWQVSIAAALQAETVRDTHVVHFDRLTSQEKNFREDEVSMLHEFLGELTYENVCVDMPLEVPYNAWDLYHQQVSEGAIDIIKLIIPPVWEDYCAQSGLDRVDSEPKVEEAK